jgi:chemotaxis family two-component system response regulator Rcp1
MVHEVIGRKTLQLAVGHIPSTALNRRFEVRTRIPHHRVARQVSRKRSQYQMWNDDITVTGNDRPMAVTLQPPQLTPTARILVIEDNVSDVFLLNRALKKQDLRFELIHLLSGGDALAFIRRQGSYVNAAIPNLILMDLNLSKYTGEDILCEIRRAGHLAGVPVCAWSSSQSRRDAAMLSHLGVSQFITKPAGLDQFMAIGKIIKDLLVSARSG